MSIFHQIVDMKLKPLLQGIKKVRPIGETDLEIEDLAYHTAQVKPGSCFVAIRGFQTDGHAFCKTAVAKGATAVVVEKKMDLPAPITQIIVEDTRDALARLSSQFFEEPTKELSLIGITGTNGKTTIAYLLEAIFEAAGRPSGIWTTIAARAPKMIFETSRTTPESYDLQKFFRNMVECSVTHAFVEVTSHALELKRVVGCHFNGGIFTNLTPEHLDFHNDMEGYFEAKERFFTERLVVSEKPNVWAVLNVDDPYGARLAKTVSVKKIRYSLKEPVELFGKIVAADLNGMTVQVKSPQGRFEVRTPLIGSFNAQNILGACGGALQCSVALEHLQTAIANFKGAPGRLMAIPNQKGIAVFVDYAHTPHALENVLSTLKPLTKGKLIVVFGCGGDRDRNKRPLMGKIAAGLADVVIVTSDNPRSENPQKIVNEVLAGTAAKEKQNCKTIVDRKGAIAHAVAVAKPNDCLVVAGKGHERFQEIAGEKVPFEDEKVLKECLHGV